MTRRQSGSWIGEQDSHRRCYFLECSGASNPRQNFSSRWIHTEALADWARQHLSSCCSVLSGGLATFHAFNFDKYVTRQLGGFCFLFDRRFKMAAMTERIANAVCVCKRCPERALRVAELYA